MFQTQQNADKNEIGDKGIINKHNLLYSSQTEVIEERQYLCRLSGYQYWKEIQKILKNMIYKKNSARQIVQYLGILKSIEKRGGKNVNQFGMKVDKFRLEQLQRLYYHELSELYQKIAQFVLKNHDKYKYPLFKKQHKQEHTFNKESILLLICQMALLLPSKSQKTKSKCHKQNNFYFIFKYCQFKTKCIIQYLKRQLYSDQYCQRYLTIRRQICQSSVAKLVRNKFGEKLCCFRFAEDQENIQDYFGDVKVDFANQFIGGGALSQGCVQEQIMFANHPELYITMLLCEPMNQNEAIHLIGFKKYHCNQGYSPQRHLYNLDQQKRVKQYITAIDALYVPQKSHFQFRKQSINRQILKAFTGFSWKQQELSTIVTGNWGCGAFGGQPKTKLLIQLIACSLAGKQMVYCPFGKSSQLNNKAFFTKITKLTIGQLYNLLIQSILKCLKQSYTKPLQQIDIYQHISFLIERKQ